jgi:hypothetical protein
MCEKCGIDHNEFGAKIHAQVVDDGAETLMKLLAGPSYWPNLSVVKLNEGQARMLAMLYKLSAERDLNVPGSFVEVMRTAAHTAVDHMIEELELWAIQNNRGDLTMRSIDQINSVLPESERITE